MALRAPRVERRSTARSRARGSPPTSATVAAEADFTARLAVLEASRLRLATALARAERGSPGPGRAARRTPSCSPSTGSSPCSAYLGERDRSREVVADLEPLLRERAAHLAAPVGGVRVVVRGGRRGRLDEARALRRRGARAQPAPASRRTPGTSRPTWAGTPGSPATSTRRRRIGRRRSRRPRRSTTRGGTPSRPACSPPRSSRPATRPKPRPSHVAGWPWARPRWQAAACDAWPPLAALGDGEACAEATRLLDEVECPPGHAWVTGADVYLLLDRADVLARDDQGPRPAWPHSLRRAVDEVGPVTKRA